MKMKWKLFGLLLGCAMLLVMPQLALADETASLIVNGEDIIAAADHTVQCGEGMAKYDPATNTLTLNNVTINKGSIVFGRLIEAQGLDLNIALVGENTLDGSAIPSSAGICVLGGNLNITGQAGSRLDINVDDSNGITIKKSNIEKDDDEPYNLSINGVAVNIESTGNAIYVRGSVEIKNDADVTAAADGYNTGIYGQAGVVIDNAKVNATSAGANAINSTQTVEIKNGADVVANGYAPGITGITGVIINGATVNAASETSNGVFSEGNVAIRNGADVTADGYYPGIYGQNGVAISGSKVNVTSTGDVGIYSLGNISITDNANVIAVGTGTGIKCSEGVTISGSVVNARATAEENGAGIYGYTVVLTNNADVTADGAKYGVGSYANVDVSGSRLTAKSTEGTAVHSPDTINISNGSNIIINDCGTGIWGKAGVNITDSNADINAKSFGMFSDGNVRIAGKSVINIKSLHGNGMYVSSVVEIVDGADVTVNSYMESIFDECGLIISDAKVNAVSECNIGLYCPLEDIRINNANVTAVGDIAGIKSTKGVAISGSVVNARATAEENGDGIACEEGNITISGASDITASGSMTGIYSPGIMSISGGTVNATSDGNIALHSKGNMVIADGADITANGYYAGVWSQADLNIFGSEVKSESTGKSDGDMHRGSSIYAGADMNIVNSKIQSDSANGISVFGGRNITISEGSDVTANGTDTGISCAEKVKINGSKVKATGETGIKTGDTPEKGDLYIVGSWVETSSPTNEALTAVNSVLIEDGVGTVSGNAVLPGNAVIADGQTLTVSKSESLTIPNGKSLTVEQGGKLIIEDGGKVVKQQGATFTNNGGTVEGTVTENKGSSSGGGGGGGALAVQSYNLTFDTNGGSSIKAVSKTASETVNLADYKPTKDGYEFDGWYADKELKNKITEIKMDGNKTVYAAWREAGASNGSPFADIKNDQWFYDDVMFVYEKGLMNGASDNAFDPSGTATRGMLAAILWRQAGSPAAESAAVYNDVPAGRYYTDAISWTTEKGVYTGFGEGVFRPDEEITREQLAAVLYRYAKFKGADVTKNGDIAGFADAGKVSAWAQEPLKWAVGSGIVNGQGNNTLNPQGMAQRADIAAMLHRFLDKF